jgi:predicted nucleic acid-binding protein
MNPPNPQTPPNKPLVILDTNIFGYLLDVNKISQVLGIMLELSNTYESSMSSYTRYELVSKGTKDVQQLIDLLQKFRTFIIDDNVLVIAGLMTCLHVEKGGDSIIAATALMNTAVILTANHKHYPEPYFHEQKYWHIDTKSKDNRTTTMTVHLLQVDYVRCGTDFGKIELVQEANKQLPPVSPIPPLPANTGAGQNS